MNGQASNPYPSDWQSRRTKVLKRDNHRCQNCGREGGNQGPAELHAHHVVPRKDGGSDKVSNLRTLCKECHNAIHHEGKKAPTAADTHQAEPVDQFRNPHLKDAFDHCPFCGDENIGPTPKSNRHIHCGGCDALFSPEGYVVSEIYELDRPPKTEDVPSEIQNNALSPAFWQKVAESSSIPNDKLAEYEKRSQKRATKLHALYLSCVIVPLILLILMNSIEVLFVGSFLWLLIAVKAIQRV